MLSNPKTRIGNVLFCSNMNPRSLDSTVLAELRLVFVHDCYFCTVLLK